MRSFIALELSAIFKNQLSEQLQHFKDLHIQGRYSSVEQLHITCSFLNDISPQQITYVSQILKTIGATCNQIPIVPSHLSVFKSGTHKILVLRLCYEKNNEFKNLMDALEIALKTYGIPFEKRIFIPHITLIRNAVFPANSNIAQSITQNPLSDSDSTLLLLPLCTSSSQASYITLFQSVLSHTGAKYIPLYRVPLRRNNVI